jgi:2'-5' RNA ligase
MSELDNDLLVLAECWRSPVRTLDAAKLTNNGTTYACALPDRESRRRLLEAVLATEPPFDPAELRDHAHVTLVYSRKAGADMARLRLPEQGMSVEAHVCGLEYWDGHNDTGYVVVKLESQGLHDLHERLKAAGAEHSFPDYSPHMTVAAKVGPKTPAIEAWLQRAAPEIVADCNLSVRFDRVQAEDIRED